MSGEIVISGVSGKFPNAENVQEFSEKLLNKVYLVGESRERFNVDFKDYPKYIGCMKNLDKFDAALYGASSSTIKMIDPQIRLLTEIVCEAIFDAGYSPEDFKGSNTGVYVGCTQSDSESYWKLHGTYTGSAGIMSSTFALPNRISFLLDLKGPSMTTDTACSSSFYALNAAVGDIKSGKCDAAIVAGTNLILSPVGMEQNVK